MNDWFNYACAVYFLIGIGSAGLLMTDSGKRHVRLVSTVIAVASILFVVLLIIQF